jgi:hypothetical protein
MQTFDNNPLNQGKNHRFSTDIVLLKTMEPVVIVISLPIDLFSKLVRMKIERVLPNKELMHDNPQ